jgi:hypothetical protein
MKNIDQFGEIETSTEPKKKSVRQILVQVNQSRIQ